jgi:hypothetical protein
MNDVFGRSMFAPKTAAREKLRNMGGIVASSAPLMQAAQGYGNGGGVNPWDDKSSQGDLAKLIESISGGIGALMTPSERLVNPSDTMAPPAPRSTPSFGGMADSMRAPSVEELIAPYSLENASGEQGQENDMLMQRGYADQRDTLSSMIPSGKAPDASMAPDGFLSSPKSETNNIRIGEPAATLSSAIKETRGGQNSGQATASLDPLRLASIASDTLVNGDPNADNDAANALLEEAGLAPAKTLKGRVRQIESLYNDLIGFDDKDRNKQMYLMLAMAGAAMASGTSPDALTNISAGFKVGAEQLANFDAKDRERRDTISLKAIERGLTEMDTEAATRAATATKAADRKYDERIRAEDRKYDEGITADERKYDEGITADERDFEFEKEIRGYESAERIAALRTADKNLSVSDNPHTMYNDIVDAQIELLTKGGGFKAPDDWKPEIVGRDLRKLRYAEEVAKTTAQARVDQTYGPDWETRIPVGTVSFTPGGAAATGPATSATGPATGGYKSRDGTVYAEGQLIEREDPNTKVKVFYKVINGQAVLQP